MFSDFSDTDYESLLSAADLSASDAASNDESETQQKVQLPQNITDTLKKIMDDIWDDDWLELVKDFYRKVKEEYYNLFEDVIPRLNENDIILPTVWNFLYNQNENRKKPDTPFDNPLPNPFHNNDITTDTSPAKNSKEYNLDTAKGIKEAIDNDITCKDVNKPWPGAGHKTRARGTGKGKRKPSNQKDTARQEILNKYIDEIFEDEARVKKLQVFLPVINNDIDQTFDKDDLKNALKNAYSSVKDFKKHEGKADKLEKIEEKYLEKLKSYAKEVGAYKLPKLKLEQGWKDVTLNFNKTNIEHPIRVLKKKNSYSVFFGNENFIIKYGNKINNENGVKTLLEGKKKLHYLKIENDETENDKIVFESNDNNIVEFETLINTLEEEKLHFLKLENGKFKKNSIDVKDASKTPEFLKKIKLKDEQAFIFQQAPQNWLIFHDPGVGKTLNALVVAIQNLDLKSNKKSGNIHVVAPSISILKQWQKTFDDFIISEKTDITLTIQTQNMFTRVCSEGGKGSFYDYYGNNEKGGFIDDYTLQNLEFENETSFTLGPNVDTILTDRRTDFRTFFLKDLFLKDFIRAFWPYCFLFESSGEIYFYANVVKTQTNKKNPKLIDFFRPMNQNEVNLKKISFQKFTKTVTKTVKNSEINTVIKRVINTNSTYSDYGKIKIAIINKNIEQFKWNEVPKKDPIEVFPMLGKNTILIIDESHNVVSDNLEKKSVRFVSDVGRHCKHIICCSATPFNTADNIENQMYAYGRILNDDPIHYFNKADKKEQTLIDGLDLVRNKVTGKKKVTDKNEQKQKINNVLKRLTIKGDLRNTLQANQDLLFRRLNYDFFQLFKPLTNFFSGTTLKKKEKKDLGLDEINNEYVHLSSEMQSYSVDKNIDFAKRRILYRQLQHIFNIDTNKETEKLYPTVHEKVIMFSFEKVTSKRFPEINLLNRNDYMVAYKTKATKKKYIDRIWNNGNKIYYCYDGTGKEQEEVQIEDSDDVLTVFSNVGTINSKIFVPDLIPSKIKFMVEEALENIILYHKNVMIYSFLQAQNKYNKEVFKMYNVQEIEIVTDKETTKNNVIRTLQENGIITNGALKKEVAYKLRLKWRSWEKTAPARNRNAEYQQKDNTQITEYLEVTDPDPLPENTYDDYNTFTENEKEKLWKQRILGKGALPYYIAKPIDGKVTSVEERQVIQELFSIGILDICLISDAGAQGTDFKSTRESMMYVASTDGRAVPANIMQFKGRLNRKNSHEICPPEFRKVTYTRICLYKFVRATKDQSKKMSHFFYYKVPKKGFAIDFLYTQDFANMEKTKFPRKCPFCNLLTSKNSSEESCTCKVELTNTKEYYYKKPSSNEVSLVTLHNEIDKVPVTKTKNETTFCKEFYYYDNFLKRLLNLEFVTLLLKTESIEHNYYAQKIDDSNTINSNDMRFMAIKEKDYWYLKRICYKDKLSTTLNLNLKNPSLETVQDTESGSETDQKKESSSETDQNTDLSSEKNSSYFLRKRKEKPKDGDEIEVIWINEKGKEEWFKGTYKNGTVTYDDGEVAKLESKDVWRKYKEKDEKGDDNTGEGKSDVSPKKIISAREKRLRKLNQIRKETESIEQNIEQDDIVTVKIDRRERKGKVEEINDNGTISVNFGKTVKSRKVINISDVIKVEKKNYDDSNDENYDGEEGSGEESSEESSEEEVQGAKKKTVKKKTVKKKKTGKKKTVKKKTAKKKKTGKKKRSITNVVNDPDDDNSSSESSSSSRSDSSSKSGSSSRSYNSWVTDEDYLINEPVDSIVATYPYLSLE